MTAGGNDRRQARLLNRRVATQAHVLEHRVPRKREWTKVSTSCYHRTMARGTAKKPYMTADGKHFETREKAVQHIFKIQTGRGVASEPGVARVVSRQLARSRGNSTGSREIQGRQHRIRGSRISGASSASLRNRGKPSPQLAGTGITAARRRLVELESLAMTADEAVSMLPARPTGRHKRPPDAAVHARRPNCRPGQCHARARREAGRPARGQVVNHRALALPESLRGQLAALGPGVRSVSADESLSWLFVRIGAATDEILRCAASLTTLDPPARMFLAGTAASGAEIREAPESTPPSLVVDVEIRTNARGCGTSRPAYEFIERLDRAARSRGPGERAWGRRTKAELDRLDREIALALRRR